MSYAEVLMRSPPPHVLKQYHYEETNELFRRIKGYDGAPETVVRQFSCIKCQHCWWKRVRVIKEVSKCKKCFVKYDPIPVKDEFGFGKFECDCGNSFLGWTQMGKPSICHLCHENCYPIYIVNKEPNKEVRNLRNKSRHSCSACKGCGSCPIYREILAYSTVHISTGSTLNSLTAQHRLDQRFLDDFDRLQTLNESDSESGTF